MFAINHFYWKSSHTSPQLETNTKFFIAQIFFFNLPSLFGFFFFGIVFVIDTQSKWWMWWMHLTHNFMKSLLDSCIFEIQSIWQSMNFGTWCTVRNWPATSVPLPRSSPPELETAAQLSPYLHNNLSLSKTGDGKILNVCISNVLISKCVKWKVNTYKIFKYEHQSQIYLHQKSFQLQRISTFKKKQKKPFYQVVHKYNLNLWPSDHKMNIFRSWSLNTWSINF